MSAEVTIRIFARPLTFGVNPSIGAVDPTLRQYAGALAASTTEVRTLKKGQIKIERKAVFVKKKL
jgi:hypothetical protein